MIVRACALLALVALAGCKEGESGRVFIALQSDFASFRSWPRYALGDAPLEGHAVGPRFGYLKEKAPPGAKQYPVGAIIVKTVERGATPEEWDVFAMAKRTATSAGGTFPWEFFVLKMNADAVPIIVSRGLNPTDPDTADGSTGYGGALTNAFTCPRCHGVGGTAATDHVLSPILAPGAQ